jgi:hypothetical protein
MLELWFCRFPPHKKVQLGFAGRAGHNEFTEYRQGRYADKYRLPRSFQQFTTLDTRLSDFTQLQMERINRITFPDVKYFENGLVREKNPFTIELWQNFCVFYLILDLTHKQVPFYMTQDTSVFVNYCDTVLARYASFVLTEFSSVIPEGLTLRELTHVTHDGQELTEAERLDYYRFKFNQIKNHLSQFYIPLWVKLLKEHGNEPFLNTGKLLIEFRKLVQNQLQRATDDDSEDDDMGKSNVKMTSLDQSKILLSWLCFLVFALADEDQKKLLSVHFEMKTEHFSKPPDFSSLTMPNLMDSFNILSNMVQSYGLSVNNQNNNNNNNSNNINNHDHKSNSNNNLTNSLFQNHSAFSSFPADPSALSATPSLLASLGNISGLPNNNSGGNGNLLGTNNNYLHRNVLPPSLNNSPVSSMNNNLLPFQSSFPNNLTTASSASSQLNYRSTLQNSSLSKSSSSILSSYPKNNLSSMTVPPSLPTSSYLKTATSEQNWSVPSGNKNNSDSMVSHYEAILGFPSLMTSNNRLPRKFAEVVAKSWQALCSAYSVMEYFATSSKAGRTKLPVALREEYVGNSYSRYANQIIKEYSQDLPEHFSYMDLCQGITGHSICSSLWTTMSNTIQSVYLLAYEALNPKLSSLDIKNNSVHLDKFLLKLRRKIWDLEQSASSETPVRKSFYLVFFVNLKFFISFLDESSHELHKGLVSSLLVGFHSIRSTFCETVLSLGEKE